MNQTMNEAADHVDGSSHFVGISVRQQLDALSKGMDTHLEELRAGLLRHEEQNKIKKALLSALPDELALAPESVRTGNTVYRADAELGFRVATREQVLELMDALPGVPVVMVAAGCTSFVPEERFVEDSRGTHAMPVGEVLFQYSSWCGDLQEEYSWWTKLDGLLVQVRATTNKGCQPATRSQGTSRNLGHHRVATTWSYSGLPAGSVLQWHGGSRSIVAPISVHQRKGVTFREACRSLQDFTAKVESDQCEC